MGERHLRSIASLTLRALKKRRLFAGVTFVRQSLDRWLLTPFFSLKRIADFSRSLRFVDIDAEGDADLDQQVPAGEKLEIRVVPFQ